jgi:TolB-like protein
MGRIFLSYARADRACAERLARALEAAGHSVWWDRHIDTGEEFAAEIEDELARADVIAVAWSSNSGKSAWVRDEAGVGRDTGRLLPLSIDGTAPPIGFRQFQTLDLAGWSGRSKDARTETLLRAVERRLKSPGTKRPFTPPKGSVKASGRLRSRRLWAAVAALLLILSGFTAFILLRESRAEAEPASLAVLPFKNLAAGDSYFAEGVAEEIANALSREPQFRVAGRTSSAMFKDAADVRDVGRRLHVAYVLEGSVRSAGRQVRVDVALVDAKGGMRLWSQNFRGDLNDIFAIQDSIGRQVAEHVRKQLVRDLLPRTLKTSGEVYSLYVTARSLMHQREPSKIDAAIDLLKRAVTADPNYAPAWARLALALSLKETYDEGDGPFAPEKERIAYAERAVSLAPGLADAHAILGLILQGNQQMDAAKIAKGRDELEKAVSLNPNDPESWYWLHYSRLAELDFDGALDALRRSARIDPFFFLVDEHLPALASDLAHRDEAIGFLGSTIANHPDPFIRQIARSDLAGLQNDRSGAYEHAKKAREIALPDVRSIAEDRMGMLLLKLGMFDEAEQFVPADAVNMWRGKLTFPKGPREMFPRALDFWRYMDPADGSHMMPRVLVKAGRSRDLVGFYDEAFSSPENMAERYSNLGFVELAPMLAIGLQQARRAREGGRILLIAAKMCRRGLVGNAPRSFRVSCSRLWAVLGQKELAIATIEKVVAEGWRPSGGEFSFVTDEPAYAELQGDPRVKRVDAILAREAARERRELLATGL